MVQTAVCMARRRLSRERVAEAFGRALLRARLDADMTQEQLADAARLHRTTIGLFERGLRCPSLDTFMQLADAMNADPGELMQFVDVEARRRSK